ncbi:pyrophosphatase, partial [Lacticaseibacillus paracasei subsp. paracasei Lpp123]
LLKDDHANIAEELADVTIYLLGIAEMTDVDLAQAVHKKVAINDHRVYDAQGHKHLE